MSDKIESWFVPVNNSVVLSGFKDSTYQDFVSVAHKALQLYPSADFFRILELRAMFTRADFSNDSNLSTIYSKLGIGYVPIGNIDRSKTFQQILDGIDADHAAALDPVKNAEWLASLSSAQKASRAIQDAVLSKSDEQYVAEAKLTEQQAVDEQTITVCHPYLGVIGQYVGKKRPLLPVKYGTQKWSRNDVITVELPDYQPPPVPEESKERVNIIYDTGERDGVVKDTGVR